MSGAEIVIHKQNKYIKIFNSLGAVNPEHAIVPEDYGIRRSFLFNRMVARGVFIECGGGRYYIDNQAVSEFKRDRLIRGLVALSVVLFIAFISFITTSR